MSDGDALLRAILEHPAQDAPRLMYADWLQENGNESRAEFIRAQCANRNRFSWFIGGHDSTGWHPHTHECGDKSEFGVSRGFVCEVCLTLAAFVQHAKSLFSAHPIERVTLADKSPWENATNPATHFGWWCENELMDRNTESDVLPLPVMLCMDSDDRRQDRVIASRFDRDRMHGVILFEDRDTARDALSRACVAYGRSLAGLSPTVPA